MDRAEMVAAKVGDLPALPQVATKLISVIQNPSSTVVDLEGIIAKDQALSAKVLRVSNSAFYGARREITTLRRAIVTLGFDTLRSVVLTGASESLHRAGRSNFKDKILWEHSLAVAIAARTIAIECNYAGLEEAYLGGLLHDIGKVALDTNLPDEYQRVMELVYNEGQSFLDAEIDVLGFDHTEVGGVVMERWNLAPELREAVQLHHQPLGAEIAPTLCAIVSLANSLCVQMGIGPERDSELELTDLESTLMLTLDPERLSEIAESVKTNLTEEKSVLSLA